MKSDYIHYLKKLLIYSAVIAIFSFILAFFLPEQYVSPAMPFILVFFIAVSLLTHYFVLRTLTKRMSQFVNFFMIAIFVKLLIYIVIIVVYGLMNTKDLIPFVVTFFLYYLLYTLFELISMLKLQKKNKTE